MTASPPRDGQPTDSRARRCDPLADFVLRSTVPADTDAPDRGVDGGPATRGVAAEGSSQQAPPDAATSVGVEAVRARLAATTKVHRPADRPQPSVRQRLLETARTLVTEHGPAISLAQVANAASIPAAAAAAEFPDAESLLQCLMLAEVEALVTAVAHRELSEALTAAAVAVSQHPVLEALGGAGDAVLARMARIDVNEPGWRTVGLAVDAALHRSGRRGTPMVLRWLASMLCAPAEPEDIVADVQVLLTALAPMTALPPWSHRRTG